MIMEEKTERNQRKTRNEGGKEEIKCINVLKPRYDLHYVDKI